MIIGGRRNNRSDPLRRLPSTTCRLVLLLLLIPHLHRRSLSGTERHVYFVSFPFGRRSAPNATQLIDLVTTLLTGGQVPPLFSPLIFFCYLLPVFYFFFLHFLVFH